jgi:hypothetical protein
MSNTIEVIYQPIGNNLQCTSVVCDGNMYSLQDQNQILGALSCLNGRGLNDVVCQMSATSGQNIGNGMYGPPGQVPGQGPGQGPYPGTGQVPGQGPYPGSGQGPYPGTRQGSNQGPYPGTGRGAGQGPYQQRPGQGPNQSRPSTSKPAMSSEREEDFNKNVMKGAIGARSVEEATQRIKEEQAKGKNVVLVSTSRDCPWCDGLKGKDISNFVKEHGNTHSVVHLHAYNMREHNKENISAGDRSWPSVTHYPMGNKTGNRIEVPSGHPQLRDNRNRINPNVLHHLARSAPRPAKKGGSRFVTQKNHTKKNKSRKNKLQYTLQQKYVETPTSIA